VRMRIMFGPSGPWMTRVGGPQPAPSKQTATNASTAERICRSGGLGGLVVARPMKGRLYPLSGSPLRAPICTPVVHQPTRTKANTTNALRRKSAILQAFLNNRERARRYGSDFARRRSGVRIPSAPLLKYLPLRIKCEGVDGDSGEYPRPCAVTPSSDMFTTQGTGLRHLHPQAER
jgi:hypothetical protein